MSVKILLFNVVFTCRQSAKSIDFESESIASDAEFMQYLVSVRDLCANLCADLCADSCATCAPFVRDLVRELCAKQMSRSASEQ